MSAAIAPAPASAGPSGGSSSGTSNSGGSAGSSPGSTPGGEAAAQGTAGAQSPEAQQQAEVRRLSRIEKVNGKEMKLEATEDELWATYNRKQAIHDAARKNAEERKQLQQQREAFLAEQRRLAEDPFHAIRKDPSFNELEFLQKRLHGLLNDQNRDPRDLEISRIQQEKRQLEEQIQQRDAKMKEEQELEAENEELRQIGGVFARALKDSKLPTNDLTLDMMGKAYFTAEEDGIELSPVELVAETRRVMTQALDNCAENMADEDLLDMFPKFSARLHRALVAKYKRMANGGQQQPSQSPPPPAAPRVNGEAPKQLTEREEWEKLQREAAGQGRRVMRFGV